MPDPAASAVAVYGTLRRAQRNHRLLDDVPFLGTGFVDGTLYDVPRRPYHAYPYPALVDVPADLVAVEVYGPADEVLLKILDALEGYDSADEAGSHYVRRAVAVHDGPVERAWVYFFQGPRAELGEVIPGGDWVAFSDS